MFNSYCPAAWKSIEITPEGTSPCCWYYPIASRDQFTNIDEALNSPSINEIRKKMLLGEKIQGCNQCYEMEKHGIQSKRQSLIKEFGHTTDVELRYLFLTLDNLCNLRCRGCNSGASHLWYQDELDLYGKAYSPKKYSKLNLTNREQFQYLEHLEIAGGEPFYSKETENFLKFLLDNDIAKNINFSITTNCTIKPSKIFLEFMMKCKQLNLSISIDGVGELNDYFRSGSNFKEVFNTAQYFYSLHEIKNNLNFVITTTATVYNINELKSIENMIDLTFPKATWVIKRSEYPTFTAVRHLPKEYKDNILNIMKDWDTRYNHLREVLAVDAEDQFSHFINFHEGLDQIRKESCPNNLLTQYINEYKSENQKVNSKLFFIKHIEVLNNDI
jgi:sulfatase maturation enzyme AslB (radical SAM superfamily)